MNRFAVVAAVLFLSLTGSAQTEPCRSVSLMVEPSPPAKAESVREIASIDFDRDGKLDLVGVTDESYCDRLVWWKGKGDHTFHFPAAIATVAPYAPGEAGRPRERFDVGVV